MASQADQNGRPASRVNQVRPISAFIENYQLQGATISIPLTVMVER